MIKPLAKRTRSKSNSTRHVRDLLRLAVVSRAFSVRGGALPSEAELMIEVGATRNVVREALNLLRDEGLIERLPGAGTFVASEKILHRFDILHGVGDGYPNRRHRMLGELPTVAVITAPPLIATKLGLDPGGPCLRVDAWVGFDEVPFSLSTSYLPAGLEEPLRAATFNGDWYELLESIGLELEMSAMSIEASVADDVVAPWLGVELGAPVLLFTRHIRSTAGRPLEFGFVRVRGDRVLLQVPLPRALAGRRDPEPVEACAASPIDALRIDPSPIDATRIHPSPIDATPIEEYV